jgi:hypothetical protein
MVTRKIDPQTAHKNTSTKLDGGFGEMLWLAMYHQL